jgi:type I restriction enzyme S subunit
MTQVRPREAQQILESMVVARYQMYPEYRDTGIEWLGQIPSHWKIERLKYATNLNPEVLSENTHPDYLIEYVDISNVNALGEILEVQEYRFEDAPSRARRVVRQGDTIISTVRTYLKAIAFLENPSENLIVSTGFAVLRPKPNLHPKFLAYVVQAVEFIDTVVANSTGVSYPAIAPSRLGDLPIWFPVSIDEQRAIAAFLDRQTAKIDALIAKKRELIAALHEKRSAIISHAVTKGLNPDAPMKDSGIEWLGEIPAGWDIIALKHALRNYEYGISASLSGTGSYRVLTMGHVQDSKLLIPEEGCLTERPSLFLQHHDLVFNRTNSLELVGKVGIFEGVEADEISIASYLVRMQTNDRANPLYLNYLLNSGWMLAEAKSRALPSINQANLNPTRYTNIKIPLPPRTEQETIISYLDHQVGEIDAVIMTAEATIERLQEYRSALISAAVTGRIDVRGKAGVS